MAWSPGQYLKFEDERTRPARDLLAQVAHEKVERVFDLGCGPGNSTELLAQRFASASVSGVDSDAAMLESARARLPGIVFHQADLATWVPEEKADVLYANAVFQWLPDHLDIMVKLMDHLRPGGLLAVQMPDNLSEPSHAAMAETAQDGPWAERFTDWKKRAPLPSPATCFDRLAPKAAQVDIWHTIYNHPMADATAIVEWVKGTGLRPWLEQAGETHRDAFLAAYTQRIERAYPPLADGRRLLRFPRLFIVATKTP